MHGMRDRDSHDAITTLVAIVVDMVTIFGAELLSVWVRYSSGLIPINDTIGFWLTASKENERNLYSDYIVASGASLLIYLAVFQILKLYTRPQDGTFSAKIPRIVRGCLLGGAGVLVATGLLKNTFPYISNGAILISMVLVTLFVLIEKAIAFHIEILAAKRAHPCHKAIILGANEDAAAFVSAVSKEPRMRTQISGILTMNGETPSPKLDSSLIKGTKDDLQSIVTSESVDLLVVATHELNHEETVALVIFCEQHLIRFSMIPDLFRMMTTKMDFQMVGAVPLVGIGRWPLDQVWNRIKKRLLDIVGALFGLLVSLPFILISAIIIKLESPGPIFYKQERCGRRGKTFNIYKLRTMRIDAEKGGKPGWTSADDPRRTKSGAFMRRWNIDELPQFFNVLRGEMSLVGPRPERPYFVEQFTPDVEHYMWRHVSKPGLTGWAQVNGLRGDTSISERVKYDLYYLENWSLAFDFKILVRTFFAYRNAG